MSLVEVEAEAARLKNIEEEEEEARILQLIEQEAALEEMQNLEPPPEPPVEAARRPRRTGARAKQRSIQWGAFVAAR